MEKTKFEKLVADYKGTDEHAKEAAHKELVKAGQDLIKKYAKIAKKFGDIVWPLKHFIENNGKLKQILGIDDEGILFEGEYRDYDHETGHKDACGVSYITLLMRSFTDEDLITFIEDCRKTALDDLQAKISSCEKEIADAKKEIKRIEKLKTNIR